MQLILYVHFNYRSSDSYQWLIYWLTEQMLLNVILNLILEYYNSIIYNWLYGLYWWNKMLFNFLFLTASIVAIALLSNGTVTKRCNVHCKCTIKVLKIISFVENVKEKINLYMKCLLFTFVTTKSKRKIYIWQAGKKIIALWVKY